MPLPFDVDAFAKDYRYPLHLVRAVEGYEVDEDGVQLRCATERFDRRHRDRYGTLVEIGVPTGAGDPVTIRLDVVTEQIVRLRMSPGAAVPENTTPMLANPVVGVRAPFEVIDTGATITITTGSVTAIVDKRPWRLRIESRAGEVLFDTIPADVFQHPPTGESHLDGASVTDAWPWFFRDLFPLGFIRDDDGLTQTFITATVRHDEHFYGLGEKFSTLDKRGQAISLWHTNATGNTWPASYKNIPFFLSSRGYGLFVNSAYPLRYHLGDLNHTRYSIHLQDAAFDAFFIYGPTLKEILPRYTFLTGAPELPPRWSFGLWMSRMSYRSQAEVEEVARRLREEAIPCDVIHIDTDWFATPWVNDLTFSQERFPDPRGMIAALRDQGFRLSLWQIPYIGKGSVFYEEGVAQGYFAVNSSGEPYHIDGFFGPTAVIDYSNPRAVAWIQAKFDPLFDMGVSVIKTDFGEGAPHDATYAGVSGLAMHNLYPLLYNRAIFEHTLAATGEGIVWGRSAYAGSQRYPVHWGGDPAALWDDLGNLWHGGLSLGLCGFPFWSVDIGGFGGTPTPELYIRWAQAGLFVSHPRAHGPIAREPWAFGETSLEIFRRYAKLRYRLLPYLWTTANHCVHTSTPVMRPLVLDWQDDPTTAVIDDQFLFGEWLLIAPIIDTSDRRKVYLPRGHWHDYWSDATFEGPQWIDVAAPIDRLPIFVKAGAIIPMAPDMQHSEEKPWDPVTLDVYPWGDSAFELIDGERRVPLTCHQSGPRVELRLGAATPSLEVIVRNGGKPVSRIAVDGSPIPEVDRATIAHVVEGWAPAGSAVIVKLPSATEGREVVLEYGRF